MGTKQKIRDLKKLISTVPDSTYVNGMMGVIDDVINGRYPDNSPLGITYTIGDLRKHKGFYQCRELIADMIGAFAGRTIRMLALNVGANIESMIEHPDFIDLMLSTEAMEGRVANIVIDRCIDQYGECPVDLNAIRALLPVPTAGQTIH